MGRTPDFKSGNAGSKPVSSTAIFIVSARGRQSTAQAQDIRKSCARELGKAMEAHEGSHALAELEASIEQRLARILQLNNEVDALRTAKQVLLDDVSAVAVTPPPKERVRSRLKFHRKDSHTTQVTDAIHASLTTEGELHRKVIVERIEAKGIQLGTGDPVRALSAYLSQDPRFTSDGRGYWRLAKEPQPASAKQPEETGPK